MLTTEEDFNRDSQAEFLQKIQESVAPVGIHFTWELSGGPALHAGHIVTDHGWKILLDRGLDIFQRYEMNDAFAIANRVQRCRPIKAFEVTYLRAEKGERA